MLQSSSTKILIHRLQKSLLTFSFLVLPSFVIAQDLSTTVVARINRHVITQADVDRNAASQIYQLQQQLFAIRKVTLESLIARQLLVEEAIRRNTSVDKLRTTWLALPVSVEQTKVEELYLKNLSAFGLMNPDEVREKLRLDLEAQARLKKYRDEVAALRHKAKVEVMLEEPRMVFAPAYQAAYAKGPADARVIIVEFSDFQCPYCRDVQQTLTQIMEKYSKEVRLQFKHLPLQNHSFALSAARAAYCGGQQGAFWSFHDALFKATEPSAKVVQDIAENLKLNLIDFNACLLSRESYLAIASDLQEAQRLGIDGTPSFLINGKILRGVSSVKEFEDAINGELNRLSIQRTKLSK